MRNVQPRLYGVIGQEAIAVPSVIEAQGTELMYQPDNAEYRL
ncbi:hypothetical protein [Serratia symbiotica]|nr:hypothetical protein [Serratia symbiotica]